MNKLNINYRLLRPHFLRKKQIPSSIFYISDGEYLSRGEDSKIYTFHKLSEKESPGSRVNFNIETYEFYIKNSIEFAFLIWGTQMTYTFGLAENKIYVTTIKEGKFKYYLLEEFVECCWEDFFLENVLK